MFSDSAVPSRSRNRSRHCEHFSPRVLMRIPEAQLAVWSNVGSQRQSKDTYATIRNALDDKNAPYAGSIEIFLQGSYGNDTNVYGKDSDVDIVALCNRVYFYDPSRLTAFE